ncbi:MAG: rRNA maturation RNase YbeY [Aestuariivirga sp.]|jgi:probable rRNA maturation factor
MNLEISIDDRGWRAVPNLRKLARGAIAAALPDQKVSLSLLFTGDAKMLEINRQWRGKATATNVLSFPVSADAPVPEGELQPLGDIVLTYGVVSREALEQQKPVGDHVAHLIVHGVLHLLGYDHEDEAEADAMEAREIAILAELGMGNPYTT